MYPTEITITADGTESRRSDQYTTDVTADELDHVAVSLNENDTAAIHRCEHCSQELDPDNTAETLDGNDPWCPGNDDGTEDSSPHKPVIVPLTWAQNAGVILDDEQDAVHVYIAADDPRGGFQMTIRRMEDGSLIMHLPYEGMSGPHMPLKEIHAGTFKLG